MSSSFYRRLALCVEGDSGAGRKPKLDEYERTTRELTFDRRSKPCDRLKTDEELAQEQLDRLKVLSIIMCHFIPLIASHPLELSQIYLGTLILSFVHARASVLVISLTRVC